MIHQTLNKINKTQRSLLPPLFFHRLDRRCLVGAQLQKDIHHWLSPPNPSTNQNFVRKARHTGTAAWIFREQYVDRMESQGIAVVDSWKAYVFRTTDEHLSLIPLLILQREQVHASVCHEFMCLSKVTHRAC